MTSKIAIIGAMGEEIQIYLDNVSILKEDKWNTYTFYHGMIYNHEVVIVKSGVGKVFSAMVCQHMIDIYGVNSVIFTGVAGGLNVSLNVGDIVVGSDSVQHDLSSAPLGFKRGQMPYTDLRFFKADEKLINLARKTDISPQKIMCGRILTGDQFFTDEERKNNTYLTDELKGDCIEMEGAAVAQVCTLNEIPHIIIRAISNKNGGNSAEDYNNFKSIVSSNSFKVVETILNNF